MQVRPEVQPNTLRLQSAEALFQNTKSSMYPHFGVSAERIKQYTSLFLSKGDTLATATNKAYGLMQGTVMKQALVMTYADAFLVIGGFFLVCVPLLLLFIGKKIAAPAHVEMAME